jgi:uncharacterized lipoprotein NlpE involved in copper resistance
VKKSFVWFMALVLLLMGCRAAETPTAVTVDGPVLVMFYSDN